ncbi:unnamed protein product [Victoria cruziana]
MGDNLMDKVSAFGERLKIGGTEVGKKMTAGMSSMSFKVKELFQGQNPTDKIVEEATMETMEVPDLATNLEICDLVNSGKISSQDIVRSIKKRIMLKNPRIQYLSLVLLEMFVKNCEKAFSEVASERVLDEMVKMIEDPQTMVNSRNKALVLIEQWGESAEELRYLPVYEETYKSLKSRGIRFPGRDNESLAPIFTPARSVGESAYSLGDHLSDYTQQQFHDNHPIQSLSPEQAMEAFDVARNSIELLSTVLSSSPKQDALKDDLTITLVEQCRRSQATVQRIVETAGDNEALLFEALNVNDEIQKVLSKYEEMRKPSVRPSNPEPAVIPVAVEPEDSPRSAKEESLIRKRASPRTQSTEDDLMDDLDEMIFGKKGGTSGSPDQKKQQKQDDLITF